MRITDLAMYSVRGVIFALDYNAGLAGLGPVFTGSKPYADTRVNVVIRVREADESCSAVVAVLEQLEHSLRGVVNTSGLLAPDSTAGESSAQQGAFYTHMHLVNDLRRALKPEDFASEGDFATGGAERQRADLVRMQRRVSALNCAIVPLLRVTSSFAAHIAFGVFAHDLTLWSIYTRMRVLADSLSATAVTHAGFDWLRRIGRGGYGSVFACRKRDTGRLYAIKCLDKRMIKLRKAVRLVQYERNVLEAIETGRLQFDPMSGHAVAPSSPASGAAPSLFPGSSRVAQRPHLTPFGNEDSRDKTFVVGLKYVFQNRSEICMVTNLKCCGDLEHLLNEYGTFSPRLAQFYLAQVLLGISHLHKRGIMHRDIKPANVLVDLDGYAMLSDLGLATFVSNSRVRDIASVKEARHVKRLEARTLTAEIAASSRMHVSAPSSRNALAHPPIPSFSSSSMSFQSPRLESLAKGFNEMTIAHELPRQQEQQLDSASMDARTGMVPPPAPVRIKKVAEATVREVQILGDFSASEGEESDEADAAEGPIPVVRAFARGKAGTPGFWSPEMLKTSADGKALPYDGSSDWWSFGCLAYSLITGRGPYTVVGGSTNADNNATLYSEVTYPREFFATGSSLEGAGGEGNDLGPAAEDLIRRLLVRDPAQRLGGGHGGVREVMLHPFFAEMDWVHLRKRLVDPPWVPPAWPPSLPADVAAAAAASSAGEAVWAAEVADAAVASVAAAIAAAIAATGLSATSYVATSSEAATSPLSQTPQVFATPALLSMTKRRDELVAAAAAAALVASKLRAEALALEPQLSESTKEAQREKQLLSVVLSAADQAEYAEMAFTSHRAVECEIVENLALRDSKHSGLELYRAIDGEVGRDRGGVSPAQFVDLSIDPASPSWPELPARPVHAPMSLIENEVVPLNLSVPLQPSHDPKAADPWAAFGVPAESPVINPAQLASDLFNWRSPAASPLPGAKLALATTPQQRDALMDDDLQALAEEIASAEDRKRSMARMLAFAHAQIAAQAQVQAQAQAQIAAQAQAQALAHAHSQAQAQAARLKRVRIYEPIDDVGDGASHATYSVAPADMPAPGPGEARDASRFAALFRVGAVGAAAVLRRDEPFLAGGHADPDLVPDSAPASKPHEPALGALASRAPALAPEALAGAIARGAPGEALPAVLGDDKRRRVRTVLTAADPPSL